MQFVYHYFVRQERVYSENAASNLAESSMEEEMMLHKGPTLIKYPVSSSDRADCALQHLMRKRVTLKDTSFDSRPIQHVESKPVVRDDAEIA